MHVTILTGDNGVAVANSVFNHSSQAVYVEDNTLTITLFIPIRSSLQQKCCIVCLLNSVYSDPVSVRAI